MKFDLADDVKTARAPKPRPVYRHADTPGYRSNIHHAMRATAEDDGFNVGEAFALATAVLVRTRDAQPGYAAEAAARMYAAIVRGNEPLPQVVRPDGSAPSARWLEVEAAPRWTAKSFDDARSA